jgi:predicted transcriptional regulator
MLEHFFGSKTRVKLLQIFFKSPEQIFFVRELSRLADVQLNAIRRELQNLEKIGVILHISQPDASQIGVGKERSKYYQLHRDFILFSELQSLLVKSQLLEQRTFIDQVKNKGGTLSLFLLTGFFSQDEKAPTDMLLVGDVKIATVDKMVKAFEESVERQIRYTIMDDKEYAERKELGDVFLYSVLESKFISILDSANQ